MNFGTKLTPECGFGEAMNLGIIGNGVVGSATGAAFASHGHDVYAYDSNPVRSRCLLGDALACDLVLVCLPTPQSADGSCDLSIVYDFFRARHHDAREANYVLRSTVPVGTTRAIAEQFNFPNLVHWPEFLTARTAMEDAANPTRLVIGCPRIKEEMVCKCCYALRQLMQSTWPHYKHENGRVIKNGEDYGMIGGGCLESGYPVLCMSSEESEAVKLFQNAFSAIKIAAFNEFHTFADAHQLDWQRVLEALLAGGWINPAHTQVPGPDGERGFGGACLPKDIASLAFQMEAAGLNHAMCRAAIARNEEDRKR